MFALMFAAIGGGLATVSLLSPLGIIPAALSAPLGGSLCAILAATHISRRRGADWISQAELETQADDMVAALRGIVAQAKDAPAQAPSETAGTRAA